MVKKLVPGHVTIIAEAGVNHNGSLETALEMVNAAAEAGADVIKFQTFKGERVISRYAPKAEYQLDNTGGGESQLEMVKRYELSEDAHRKIMARCGEAGIEFFSTPFDLESVDLLTSLGVKRLKIPSGEITNWPLLHKIGRMKKPVIMSTGMSAADEIRQALGIYLMGALLPGAVPCRAESEKTYASAEGREYLCGNAVLLHCTTQYPAPYEDVNLLAMDYLAETFGLPVGYSDHTEGISVSLAAAARGAAVIEKHFTLDKNMPGPDHKASITPGELRELVGGIRIIESSLGTAEKKAAPSEIPNRDIARKSLVALRDIKEGEEFTELNLGVKRPGTGVSPSEFWEYLGRRALRDYREDELIRPFDGQSAE